MDYKNTKWYGEFWDRAILMGYRGSRAHGTWRPPTDPTSIDDVDVIGILVGTPEQYFGLTHQDTYERMEEDKSQGITWDVVCYDVRKFVRLLIAQNPNVLSVIWMPDNLFMKITDTGRRLLDAKRVFASKKAFHAFSGYAYSQLHKMEKNECKGYMGDKRKKLIEKFGYDTKNASHLIRLLKMGIEFLSTGELAVQREDNSYLVDIKSGKYTLEEIKAEAERLRKLHDESLVRSNLPDRVDEVEAEKLLVGILRDELGVQA